VLAKQLDDKLNFEMPDGIQGPDDAAQNTLISDLLLAFDEFAKLKSRYVYWMHLK
jgi:hypothetical protein